MTVLQLFGKMIDTLPLDLHKVGKKTSESDLHVLAMKLIQTLL
ncbi:unnamed protein product [Rhodiola kirilowii]